MSDEGLSIADRLATLPEDVREAMLVDAAAEVTRRRKVQQRVQRHVFRGAALRLQTESSPELVISGPARTGKSLAALNKVHSMLMTYDGARGLIVRKTRASLTQSGLQTYEDVILGHNNPIKDGPARNNRSTYRYPNGSELVVGGMDKASRIMSTEYDIIFVQESTELTIEEWEALSTRLSGSRLPYQQLLADCNPSYPQHWLKRRESEGHVLMINSYHHDNPIFYDKEGHLTDRGRIYLERLDQLTGVRRARLRDGLWVAAEGAIYPQWSDDRNLVNPFPIPKDWRKFATVDFGYTNPLVVQWWAIDPDDRMYLYREFYHTRELVEDVAEKIRGYEDYHELEAIVCDWDAEDRATLERHMNDRPTTMAEKDVSPGIQLVQQRIIGDKEKDKGQIVIMRDSLIQMDGDLVERGKPTCTLDEIPGYAWMPDDKDKPMKIDDHGCDGMRYACMYVQSNGSAEDWVIKPH